MLTERESAGARQLISHLSEDEVIQLAKTVTMNMINISSVKEATNVVIAYTPTPYDLLKRKRIKRDIMFRYLHREGVNISPTSDKYMMIQKILALWESKPVALCFFTDDDAETDTQMVVCHQLREQQRQATGDTPSMASTASSSNTGGWDLSVADSMNSWRDETLLCTSVDQEMALQFSRWFYLMLNACNPVYTTAGGSTQDSFGVQHFFRDCSMCVISKVGGQDARIDSHTGAELVTDRLKCLVQAEQIIFNPNLDSSGIRGSSDHHGRRVVFICGTIHRGSDVLGLFEQQFGLVRDPLANNNWKIKTTRLAMIGTESAGPTRFPTLDETRQICQR